MIKSFVGHIQININMDNLAFYKDLFALLEWSTLYEDPTVLGVGCNRDVSLWFAAAKGAGNDYDCQGMNHLGITVGAQADVDAAVVFLQQHNVPALFETPRHRPEFSAPGQTYYQVMFESPDRVLFEIVYTGPISE
jgi:catechol 2,3-dioxygenase-like lactoylglutathione lyase family enzyme